MKKCNAALIAAFAKRREKANTVEIFRIGTNVYENVKGHFALLDGSQSEVWM